MTTKKKPFGTSAVGYDAQKLRVVRDLVAGWLLTLEQEHEMASHQDQDTQISSQTCHVCAGIDALWQALRETREKSRIVPPVKEKRESAKKPWPGDES